jgi:hypothetical protein
MRLQQSKHNSTSDITTMAACAPPMLKKTTRVSNATTATRVPACSASASVAALQLCTRKKSRRLQAHWLTGQSETHARAPWPFASGSLVVLRTPQTPCSHEGTSTVDNATRLLLACTSRSPSCPNAPDERATSEQNCKAALLATAIVASQGGVASHRRISGRFASTAATCPWSSTPLRALQKLHNHVSESLLTRTKALMYARQRLQRSGPWG